jgi:hypothetical protein
MPPDAIEPRLRDNRYNLANRKAKRLKGLLARRAASAFRTLRR